MWSTVELCTSKICVKNMQKKFKMPSMTEKSRLAVKESVLRVHYVKTLVGRNYISFTVFAAESFFSPVTHRTRGITIGILFGSHLSRTRTIGEGGRIWLFCLSSVPRAACTIESVKRKSSVSCVYSWKRRNCESRINVNDNREKNCGVYQH